MQITKQQILQTLADHGKELKAYGVEQIGLFGSHVRNEAGLNSDIDLLVNINKNQKTFRNFMSLSYYLENLLGNKIDLITQQSLSPYIGPHILNTVEYVSLAN